MGNAIIVACPTCGALGKAGETCEFCGASIPLPNGSFSEDTTTHILIDKQTIPAEEFANKISKYHKVYPWEHNLAVVSIGDLQGVINRNGDLVVPLNYKVVKIVSDSFASLDKSLYDYNNQILYKDALTTIPRGEISISEGLDGQLLIKHKYTIDERARIDVCIYDLSQNKVVGSVSRSFYWGHKITIVPSFNGYILHFNESQDYFITKEGVKTGFNSIGYVETEDVLILNDHTKVNSSEDISLSFSNAKEQARSEIIKKEKSSSRKLVLLLGIPVLIVLLFGVINAIFS